MTLARNLRSGISQVFQPSPEQQAADREARPFFIIITVLLGAISLMLLAGRFTLPQGLVYSVLLLIHIALHWLSTRFAAHAHSSILYVVLQGAVGVALVGLSRSPELTLALYAALMAEAIGLFGPSRLMRVAVFGYLLLVPLGFFISGGVETLSNWAPPAVTTLLLLSIFMLLYRREAQAREETQHLLAELEGAHRQLADYAAQVESLTLAAERQRMARELHDTLAQGLTGVVLQLEAAKNHLHHARTKRAGAIIEQAMERARTSLTCARQAIDDLREDTTLVEFIQRELTRFSQASGVACDLSLDMPQSAAVLPATTQHVERILSESLTNVAKHAQAKQVWVRAALEASVLSLEVRDNGVGFDPATAEKIGHYGLLGMQERVRLMHGTFEIQSQPGQGTCLRVRLPLKAL